MNNIKEIQSSLSEHQAVLIKNSANRFYVTGFNSSAGVVVITSKKAVFIIDFRYIEKARKVVTSCEVRLMKNEANDVLEVLNAENITELFVETDTLSLGEFCDLKAKYESIEIQTDPKLNNRLLELRSVKSEEELKNIQLAQDITDKTFSYILNNIKEGRSEKDIMLDMEFYLRKLGSEGVSFDFIVVAGKNSSLPHGVPSENIIKSGDFITMDFGAVVNGYRSDMTRTVAVGNVSDEQKTVYNLVLKAQNEAIKAIKAGVICSDIDKIARDIIYGAGYEGCFGHGLGHSVGIEIHESPAFNTRCGDLLKSGAVMTVEPGIYLENKFGVRIEDMVYVTDNGCINLTKSEKQLIVL